MDLSHQRSALEVAKQSANLTVDGDNVIIKL